MSRCEAGGPLGVVGRPEGQTRSGPQENRRGQGMKHSKPAHEEQVEEWYMLSKSFQVCVSMLPDLPSLSISWFGHQQQ